MTLLINTKLAYIAKYILRLLVLICLILTAKTSANFKALVVLSSDLFYSSIFQVFEQVKFIANMIFFDQCIFGLHVQKFRGFRIALLLFFDHNTAKTF